ncbi:MAG: hypothetical protein JNL75_08525 [Chitinophagales bacterium]|nr:hypothetical protein [Chitinophagales bacterium]
MVKISNYFERQTEDGKKFYVLEISGKAELKASKTSGNFYVSVRKTTIPATFGEETCKSMVGQNLPGSIVKVEVEPYEVVNTDSGEVTTQNQRFVYSPVEMNDEPQAIRELVEEGVIA